MLCVYIIGSPPRLTERSAADRVAIPGVLIDSGSVAKLSDDEAAATELTPVTLYSDLRDLLHPRPVPKQLRRSRMA